MSSKRVGSRLVVLGISSVLRVTHRATQIPVPLPDIIAEGVKAYWENGSLSGFCNNVGEKIGKLVEKSDWAIEPLLISEPENTSNYNAFLIALYQEIAAFFEFAQIQSTLYLVFVQPAVGSVNVLFAEEPCTVKLKNLGTHCEMFLAPTRKEEDEQCTDDSNS